MSLISHNGLKVLVAKGIITNVKPEQINSASIDITLGRYMLFEDTDRIDATTFGGQPRIVPTRRTISLKRREPLATNRIDLRDGEWALEPGQFALAQSEQVFNLPANISAEYKLKSSMARIGLEHLNAGWCDAGWNGSVLTLELKNMTQFHNIELEEGVGIGQVVFYEHEPVPTDKSYAARGRYNGDTTVSGIKE